MVMMTLQLDEYQHTQLTNSPFQIQFDRTMEWALRISNDDLLYQFRKRAGKDAPGHGLGGWYGRQGFTFGQVFSYLAKMYKLTGDLRCKEKLYTLLEEWASCMFEDGYALWPDKDKFQNYSIAYEFEKLVTGLVDAYEYTGYARSHDLLIKITDWATAHLSGKSRQGTFLGEWYTLSEGYLRGYDVFGDEKFLAFAEEWYYDELWDQFVKGDISLEKPRHAYSTVNSLSSLARRYLATGEERDLAIMKTAYADILSHHTYATGGYGPQEDLFGKPGYLGDALLSAWDKDLSEALIRSRHDPEGNCEASCCAWAVLKLCKYLQAITGKAEYGHWMEKVIYNLILPMPIPGDDGKIMYFASYYYDGAVKSNFDRRYHFTPDFYNDLGIGIHQSWQCCTGTFPQDITEYANVIYYFDENDVLLNQYIPSATQFNVSGQTVHMQCDTRYPEEETITIVVDSEKPVTFTLKLRMPAWLRDEMVVSVNGEEICRGKTPGDWLSVARVWGGREFPDTVAVTIPMHLYFEPVDSVHSELCALCYGPVVLVADDICLFCADKESPESWIHKKEDCLVFETVPGSVAGYDFVTRTFIPYYAVPEMQWYFMYCKFEQT